MIEGEEQQEHVFPLAEGELSLLWQLACPDLGQAVEIRTGEASLPSHYCHSGKFSEIVCTL